MNPYLAYRRMEDNTGWTRIDMLLSLYDGAIDRLDKGAQAVRDGNEPAAVSYLAKTQLILSELAAGVRMTGNEELGGNLLRLYEFAAHQLCQPRLDTIANARGVLVTLRDGFEAIRTEANNLERSGKLPTVEQSQMVHATA